jgi:dihydrofolate reductase
MESSPMPRTIWHCHIAASLDGKIARPDGGIEDWLVADFPAEDFGFPAFLDSVDAILMGRGSYDAARRHGDWPYHGKPTIVMTTRKLLDPPRAVQPRSGDIGEVAAELAHRGHRRVWIYGGGEIIRSTIALGRFDILEMALIPRILGEGIPLFPSGTGELALRLVKCEVKAKGALHLVYERAGAGDPREAQGAA